MIFVGMIGSGNDTKSCYEEIKKDYTLIYTTDIDTYLTLLQDTRYTIFISVRDECADALKDTTLNHLKNLGLEADLKGKIFVTVI